MDRAPARGHPRRGIAESAGFVPIPKASGNRCFRVIIEVFGRVIPESGISFWYTFVLFRNYQYSFSIHYAEAFRGRADLRTLALHGRGQLGNIPN